jgi:hypothetical protein
VSLDWTEEEQRALEAGVQSHPPDRFDTVQRYVKIAAMLPRKSVRDVALRVRWTINQQLLKKRKPGEVLLPTGASGAKKATVPGGALLPPKAPTLPPMPMVRLLLLSCSAVMLLLLPCYCSQKHAVHPEIHPKRQALSAKCAQRLLSFPHT